jgi:hypothetical protein
MIAEYLDEDEVRKYVGAVRDAVAEPELRDQAQAAADTIGLGAADPVEAIRSALPNDPGPPSSGGDSDYPFLSRDPAVSLLQTSLEDEARKAGNVAVKAPESKLTHFVHAVEALLHLEHFGPSDPDWITKIAGATLDRLAKGNHRFNPVPAEHTIADDARVVIVGDWGSGLPRALDVAKHMGAKVQEALAAGRQAHVVHLGDVYYSGDPAEYKRRVLAPGFWPVTSDLSNAGVSSWALNGNHDMYSGGYGFFDTMLGGDDRWAKQRSPDGKGTSFFRLKNAFWDIAGLDTSWDSDVLTLGQKAVLHDPQAKILEGWAAESDRRLMLLSHHQLVSAYDLGDLGTELPYKLQTLLKGKRISAWIWGHEHRCVGFVDTLDVPFMRCVGHGGIPIPADSMKHPVPPPGIWQEDATFKDRDGTWNRFGFAVMDFDDAAVSIAYYDDGGKQTRTETF